jgi:hypothetical protein
MILFPTREVRYSSFNVGARNARYAENVHETFELIWFTKVSRGLNAVSDRSM